MDSALPDDRALAANSPDTPVRGPTWGGAKRVGFRFVFAFVALWMSPFPIGALPYTEPLVRQWDAGRDALTVRCARIVLNRAVDDFVPNGSGDTTVGWMQLAMIITLALVATMAWSILDRRRANYVRLHQWLHVYLRFAVGTVMIEYGLAKVFHLQFPLPGPAKLEQAYGDASPMGLLWTFMGYSRPYNVFAGLAETVPAVLLFFRRTATLGALLLVAVLANVVALNLCYDVPVKIYSTELMLASLYIAGPRLTVLFDILVRERAVAAVPPASLFSRPRLETAARIAGFVFGGYVLVSGVWESWQRGRAYAAQPVAVGGLDGSWDVEELARDGTPLPFSADEKTRWRTVGIALYQGRGAFMFRQMDDFYDRVSFTHDAPNKTLTLEPKGAPKSSLVYAQLDVDHMTLNGTFAGHAIAAKLRRRAPREFRLVTRGFHWVNEQSFNR